LSQLEVANEDSRERLFLFGADRLAGTTAVTVAPTVLARRFVELFPSI